MARKRDRGFTLIELLVVITIIGILAAIALPNYIKAKDKAKEAETKSNLHTIQVALERYNTDSGEYPDYILGGDVDGWNNWHSIRDQQDPENGRVEDPMIVGVYITSYPTNPFITDGLVVIRSTSTESDPQQGDGDPRFGFRGNIMGNGLDDFYFYEFRAGGLPDQWTSTIETKRTLPPNQQDVLGFPELDGSDEQGLHYMFGGWRKKVETEDGYDLKTIYTFWPGNFLYRGLGSHISERQGWTHYDPGYWNPSRSDRYLLGAYGSFGQEGYDIIRLQDLTPDDEEILYRMPPPWHDPPDMSLGFAQLRVGWPPWPGSGGCGLPEVSGGGDAWLGPYYPYDSGPTKAYIYGSQDGHKDGIILVLAAGAEVDLHKF